MDKLKVIITRRPGYQKGMYGLTIGHDSSGTATVQPLKDEGELRIRLLKFGLSKDYADDLIERLNNKHDSVSFEIDKFAES